MSDRFVTRLLPVDADVLAPDGSEVRVLAGTARGSMAHFKLMPGAVSKAVKHRLVEEVWFFTSGEGRMWRAVDGASETIAVKPGVSIAIAPGMAFQFRCDGETPLEAIGVTMPPWPGADEAIAVDGLWPASF